MEDPDDNEYSTKKKRFVIKQDPVEYPQEESKIMKDTKEMKKIKN